MRECPAVAKAEIERLQSKGINPTLDEICWLASLGRKVEQPGRVANPLLSAVPVVAGCEPFYELTNQALWWLSLAAEWFCGLSKCHLLGYAHRHARIPGAFVSLATRRAAVDAVSQWRDGLAITDAEIMDAVERLADNDAPERPLAQDSKTSHSEQLARAIALTGLPRDYWETATPEEMGRVLCESIRIAGAGSGVDMDMTAMESGEALRDLLLAVMEIEKRHGK